MAELAELEGSSINQLLVTSIAQYLGSKRAYKEMSENILSEMRKVVSDGVVSLYRNGPSTLLIAFQPSGKPYYIGRTATEGPLITEKLFNLNVPHLQLGVMQS